MPSNYPTIEVRMAQQLNIFAPIYPPGFRLMENFITKDEEDFLIQFANSLQWENYEKMGKIAKRKIFSYGKDRPFPKEISFLLPRVAKELNVQVSEIGHALFTYYPESAPIGWHRDAPMYGKLLGISLLNSCDMKLRPYDGSISKVSVPLPPRSAYVIEGNVRWNWEHHIPPVKEERYSLTFRTIRLDL